MISVNKTKQIAAQIASRQAEVSALAAQKIAAGFHYQGHVYQVDGAAITAMTSVIGQLAIGIANPHGGEWRTLDNIDVPMTAAEVQTFILAAKAYAQAVRKAACVHKDQLKAFAALAPIAAYDPSSGWPAA